MKIFCPLIPAVPFLEGGCVFLRTVANAITDEIAE